MVADGQESQALPAARAMTSGPLLLIVDYAETRAAPGDLLRAVHDDSDSVRVLLLARSLGEWWDRLREKSSQAVAQQLSSAAPLRLEAPIEDTPDLEITESAQPYFATRLGVAPPADVTFELPSKRAPVLVLHTAALVAVLRSTTSPPGSTRVAVTEGVLDELLDHEARYWRRTAEACGLTANGHVLKAAVAGAALLGASDLAEAAAVAGRVPDLAEASTGELRQVLAGLAPHLEPELLTQALVVATGINDDDFRAQAVTGLAPHLPPELLTQALAVAPKSNPNAIISLLRRSAAVLPASDAATMLTLMRASLSDVSREVCLRALSVIPLRIVRTGGTEAIQEVVKAIEDSHAWWP